MSTLPIFALLSAMVAMVSNFGLPVAVVREIPKLLDNDMRAAQSFLQTSMLCSAVGAACFSAITLMFASQIARIFFKDAGFSWLVQLMSMGFFLYAVDLTFSYSLRAFQRFRELAIKNTVSGLAQKVLSILLLLAWGIKGLVIGLNIGLAMGVLLSQYFLKDSLFGKGLSYPFARVLKFSLPYYAEGFLTFLQGQADQLLVATFLSPPVLAAYYIAKRLPDSIEILRETVDQTITPALSKVSRMGRAAMESSFRKITTVVSHFAIPLGMIAASCSYPFLYLTGKEKYLHVTDVSMVLCIAVILSFFMVPITKCIFVMVSPAEKLKLTVVQSFCYVGILLLSLKSSELLAVAFGRLVYLVLSLVYATFILRRIMKVSTNRKSLFKSLASSLMAAAFIGSAQFLYSDMAVIPAIIVVGLFLWVSAVVFFMSKEDFDLVASIVPRNRAFDFVMNRIEKRLRKNPEYAG
jgi:O-antigen/teichoic acid export membrane protein